MVPAGKGKGFIPGNVLCRDCQRSGSPSIRKYLDQNKIMIVTLPAFKRKAASCLVLLSHIFTRSSFQEQQIFQISYQVAIV